MRFIDLCAGLGGFHVAASNLGMECVFASEIDPQLQSCYESNFGTKPVGDLTLVNPADIPTHDILFAGFPCQTFSKAGEQRGLADERRGGVVKGILEIVKKHRPNCIMLENVANFPRHDSGETIKWLGIELSQLGYQYRWTILSPHNYGVPQIRDRFFLVASQGNLDTFEWPTKVVAQGGLSIKSVLDIKPKGARLISESLQSCLETWQEFIEFYPKDRELPSFPVWSMEFKANYPFTKYRNFHRVPLAQLRKYRGSHGKRIAAYKRAMLQNYLPSHAMRKDECFPAWKQDFISKNRKLYRDNRSWLDNWIYKIAAFPSSLQKLEWNCKGEQRNIWKHILQIRASGVRVKRSNYAPSLVASTTTQLPIIASEKRYMTLKECARLQSLENLTYLPRGNKAYAAMGNAVNASLVERILDKLVLSQTTKKHSRGIVVAAS